MNVARKVLERGEGFDGAVRALRDALGKDEDLHRAVVDECLRSIAQQAAHEQRRDVQRSFSISPCRPRRPSKP